MLTLQANDAAVTALGLPDMLAIHQASDLAPGLEELLAKGIIRRGEVLMWRDFSGNPDTAPGRFQDLTGWECAHSSFHLEDDVPVTVTLTDHEPGISEDDQNVLLRQGLALAIRFRALVYQLQEPVPVRCISPPTRPTRRSGSTRSDPANDGTPRTSTASKTRRSS